MYRRTFLSQFSLLGGMIALASGSGCSAAPVIVTVASAVTLAAQLAQTAIRDAEIYVNAYFAANPGPALQATVMNILAKAKVAANALAALAAGVTMVTEGQYLAALNDFRIVWQDVLTEIGKLPNAQIVYQGAAAAVAPKAGAMVFVAVSPDAFAVKK